MKAHQRIIISRTDKIGDVVLTLPLAGFLKKHYPHSYIIFLGNNYTKPILETCENIDKIVEWNKIKEYPIRKQIKFFRKLNADTIIHVYPNKKIALLAKLAQIKHRIGTSHRWYHLISCNQLVHLGRKNSEKHEIELNFELLKPILKEKFSIPSEQEIQHLYGLTKVLPVPERLFSIIDRNKFNLIIHPKSKGSAREWGLNNFSQLIQLLPPEKVNIIVTGTEQEANEMQYFLNVYKDRIINLTGKLTLSEYISLIQEADGLLACSTGPLHIAAALGIHAIGLYAPMRPIFPKRWKPIGKNATYFVIDKECNKCKHIQHCECIESIKPEWVAQKILSLNKMI
ncbi:MAG: glycosyltransferase family 9 protein [Bacteroidales bacterium]|nr:glycosyltransferase family 9 protein [Bacteroidales bacterium]